MLQQESIAMELAECPRKHAGREFVLRFQRSVRARDSGSPEHSDHFACERKDNRKMDE